MNRNEQIKLIAKTANGASVTESNATVFAAIKSVARTEFYASYQVGLNPKLVFEIDAVDYETAFTGTEATEIEYKNKRYNIIRSYKTFDVIEVTVG